MNSRYKKILDQLKADNNYRELPLEVQEGFINLSSNDYLGINADKDLQHQFLNSCLNNDHRLSAASSRLLTGNFDEYHRLERSISHAYNGRSCLIFNSGYHANIGILSVLADKNDLIVADKLVHASIIDGMQLSKAKFTRFKHRDYKHLENILTKAQGKYDQIFIVSESIFSMDGDVADIPLLIDLKKKYNALLYIDEAHALGACGKNGLGYVEQHNCIHDCDFIVGTFGKALASIGAFIICDEIIKNYLVNHSRSIIYTTGLPPINLAWTNFIFSKLPDLSDRRKKLIKATNSLARELGVTPQSHILPYICGDNNNAIQLAKQLLEKRYLVKPIRYPTVPKGTARLRFSVCAHHAYVDFKKISEIIHHEK
ncbi:MAG: 8-amino-7-oxononanoate synthase [Bacteroidales bacterium]|nr:8-amino-7-oxononanoate synthase [Bacteroidales bacterium]